MKKITFISDTHTKHDQLTNDLIGGDIIIHAGDISSRGAEHEILNFLDWYCKLPYKYKIFIAGNHDFYFEKNLDMPEEFKDKGVIYLRDEMVEMEGLKIYGSPWQPEFYNWAFNLKRGKEIAKKWALIPEGLDILITHGPAFGILDVVLDGYSVGCEELYKRIFEINPKYHVCGHIHSGYGVKEFHDTTFINASSLNEDYNYRNKPIVVEF